MFISTFLRVTILVSIVLWSLNVHAQMADTTQAKIDSLTRIIPSLKAAQKIEALRSLATRYVFIDANNAIELNREALTEARAINYNKSNLIHSLQIFCFVITGAYDSAESHYQKALALTPPGDKALSGIYTNAGSLYLSSGQYATALTLYHNAQDVAEKHKDQRQLVTISTNLALVYERLGNYKKAIAFDSMAYNLAFKLKKQELINLALNNLGAHLKHEKLFKESLEVFKKVNKATLSPYLQGLLYLNLAELKFKLLDVDSTIVYGLQALDIFKQQYSQSNIAGAYLVLSKAELNRKNIVKAEEYALLAYASVRERKINVEIQGATFLLMKIYLQKNNLKDAKLYEEEYHAISNSLDTEDQAKATIEALTKYNTEKKEQENEILKRDQELKAEQLTRQRYVMVYIGTALLLVIILLIIAYRSYKLKQKTNAILRQQKQSIKQQNNDLEETLAELRATQEQLVHSEKMASLGQLTAGIAHEINNPLAFIQAGADSLKGNVKSLKKVLDEYELLTSENFVTQSEKIQHLKKQLYFHELIPELQSIAETIKIGTTRTATIIAGLNRFSRKGKEDLVLKDVSAIMDETLILVQGQIHQKIKLIRNYSSGIIVECRPVEIGQVFVNIIINAIHAIKESGEITLQCVKTNTHAEISIGDTGDGISPEVLSKIFDPFFTTKDVGKGTGLGLSITHGIIKSHGGTITVNSAVGVGTTFTITLPLEQPKA